MRWAHGDDRRQGEGRGDGRTEKLRALYGDRGTWIARYKEAVHHLVESQVVLPDDATRMLDRASALELPI